MLYITKTKDGKTFVDQNTIKSDITDLLFDIEDKKLVNRFRTILKNWTKADAYSREEYAKTQEEDDDFDE